MNFPLAWDRSTGHGYVAAVDSGLLNNAPPSDLAANYRTQFSFVLTGQYVPNREYHGTHVLGIIGATANNGAGVAGGCPTCSVAMARMNDVNEFGYPTILATSAAWSIARLVDRGFQVVNMSFGTNDPDASCLSSGYEPYCSAIDYADQKDVLLVAAAGNHNKIIPDFPARHPSVLSVGGVQNTNPSTPASWVRWFYNSWDDSSDTGYGSSHAGLSGVVAPAKAIVSTVPVGMEYITTHPAFRCADTLPTDESGTTGDGYGSCTGTSMAAPHISALAGIVRSVNPQLSRDSIKNLIRSSGSHYAAQTSQLGAGLPNARIAVDQAIAQTPNRLTPLFSMYSAERRDYFYTTVPQMAAAASWGTLQPVFIPSESSRYVPATGAGINNYFSFPGGYPFAYPLAEVWLFTTPENPKSTSVPLVPLYRLSWKCGDYTPYPPAICSSNPQHVDTAYTADPSGVASFQSWGYKLDGIEGYLYPKTLPQPAGTVRLMRKYNPVRDDHAIFPETALSAMTSQGYTESSGSDWLGYVYPNVTGIVPAIQ